MRNKNNQINYTNINLLVKLLKRLPQRQKLILSNIPLSKKCPKSIFVSAIGPLLYLQDLNNFIGLEHWLTRKKTEKNLKWIAKLMKCWSKLWYFYHQNHFSVSKVYPVSKIKALKTQLLINVDKLAIKLTRNFAALYYWTLREIPWPLRLEKLPKSQKFSKNSKEMQKLNSIIFRVCVCTIKTYSSSNGHNK